MGSWKALTWALGCQRSRWQPSDADKELRCRWKPPRLRTGTRQSTKILDFMISNLGNMYHSVDVVWHLGWSFFLSFWACLFGTNQFIEKDLLCFVWGPCAEILSQAFCRHLIGKSCLVLACIASRVGAVREEAAAYVVHLRFEWVASHL